jgi:hypothetical protein
MMTGEALETGSVVGNPCPLAVLFAYIRTDSLSQGLSLLVGPTHIQSLLAFHVPFFLAA